MGMRSFRQNPDGPSINPSTPSTSAPKRRLSRSGIVEQSSVTATATSTTNNNSHNNNNNNINNKKAAPNDSYSSPAPVGSFPAAPPPVPSPPPALSRPPPQQSSSYPHVHAHPRRNAQSPPIPAVVATDGPPQPIPPESRLEHVQKRPRLSQSPQAASPMSKLGPGPRPVPSSMLSSPLRPHTGAKKLVVKNLRPANTAREAAIKQYYETLRRDIQDALTSILDGHVPSRPYDGLYKGVEDLCRNGEAQWLYSTIQKKMEAHLRHILANHLEPAAKNASTDDRAIGLVRTTLMYWKEWSKQAATIRNVFSFLDRSYLLTSRSLFQLNDLAINLFKKILFVPRSDEKPLVTAAVLDGMCLLVLYEREDDAAKDTQLLKDAVSMMNVLALYTRLFEPILLGKSRGYFSHVVKDCAETYPLAGYVDFCADYMAREEERCLVFNFDSATKKQLLEDANRIFVAERKGKLLDVEAISRLLSDNDVGSMNRLFQLLRRSRLEKELKDPWEEYITETGSRIVNDASKAENMVVRLLLLRRDLDVMVRDAFDKNEEFTKGLREAFGIFVNDKRMNSTWGTGTSKVGEMIAKYIDMLLRGGLKALPPELLSDAKDRQAAERSGHASSGDSQDAELDRQLDSALELFRFIQGKDVFEAFYKKDLAKRLLMNRSASHDAERNMLAKFRGECGSSFTQNLEQMFKDRELADEDMRAYKLFREGRGLIGGFDLQVSILSAAAWPSYPEVPCKLPGEIHDQIAQFDRYYLSKHTGRRLTWKHNLAQCLVRAHFKKGTKELLVSGFQAVILLLFNGDSNEAGSGEDVTWTAEDIAKQTAIPTQELYLTLQSLSLGKARVLRKSPPGHKEVRPTDRFSVNAGFSDPKYRVKINMIQMKETPQENRETHERVAADRMFETQAAIVRILKSRKQIAHNDLVAEVINATKKRGAIDVGVIKQNIEKLIDKDYMERDTDTGEYVYMA